MKKRIIGLFGVCFLTVVMLIACGKKKLMWQEILLIEQLPIVEGVSGEIHSNSEESVWFEVSKASKEDYLTYMAKCEEFGYIIENEKSEGSYTAYNEKGFKINISYYDYSEEISISLEAPMKMEQIEWPSSEAGKQLPKPKSTIGHFSSEKEDGFYVYVGETTKEEYKEYVNLCMDKGFSTDYDKAEEYFSADNSKGYHVLIRYQGNKVMSIDIDAPEESVQETPVVEEDKKEDTKKEESKKGVSKKFKETMDSYEAFFDEYIAFMKKYSKSDGTDLSLITDYTEYMTEYAEMMQKFAELGDQDMTVEEAEYYLEVQLRINKKLAEIAE